MNKKIVCILILLTFVGCNASLSTSRVDITTKDGNTSSYSGKCLVSIPPSYAKDSGTIHIMCRQGAELIRSQIEMEQVNKVVLHGFVDEQEKNSK